MLAFDNPWWVITMIGVAVLLRVGTARMESLQRYRAAVLEFIDSALIALLLVFCILRPFVVQAFYIPSSSMENTLQINDRILVNKFIYFFTEPDFGDVIVFRAPRQAFPGPMEEKDFIKRVVGIPGDRIAVHDGKLWRNGQPVDEPYIKQPPTYRWPLEGEVTIPEGQLLVFGDNRNDSNDSHRWEMQDRDGNWRPAPFLPRDHVLGKAVVIFWPLHHLRFLR